MHGSGEESDVLQQVGSTLLNLGSFRSHHVDTSRECQIKDWKYGNPPHKTICGKPYTVPGEGPSPIPMQQSSNSNDIPPPDPGFIRSPELVNQLALLKDNPHVTYVLTQPDPKPDHGVALQHLEGKMLFDIMKNRAIRNGDPQAVAMMW